MSKGNIFVLMFLLSTFIVSCKFWGEIDRKRGRAGLNINGFSNVEDKDKLLKDGFEFQVGDVETNDKDKLAQGEVQGIQSSDVADSSSNTKTGIVDDKDKLAQGDVETNDKDKLALGDAQDGNASAGSTGSGQESQSSQSSVASNSSTGLGAVGGNDKLLQGSNSGTGVSGGADKLVQGSDQGSQKNIDSTGGGQGLQSSSVASSGNARNGSTGNEDKTAQGDVKDSQSSVITDRVGVVKGNQGISVASSSNSGADSVVGKDKLAQGGGANSGGAGSSVRDVQVSNVTSSSNTGAGSASSKDKLAQETQNGSSSVTNGVASESRVPQRRMQHSDEMRHNANREKEHRHPDLGVVNKSLDRGLTQEDVKSKFNILVSQVEEYENMLRHVYNDYIGASNIIRTYSKDNNGSYTSEIRRGLDKLNDRGLYDSLKRLGNIIKDHKHQGLTIAISRLSEAVGAALASERASHAIEASNAYISAINSAIVAYVESFAAVASTLSSGQFAQAAQKFAEVARACAAINKTDISTIAWAVSGVFLKNKGNLDQAKRIASRLYGRKGGELSRAIDELDAAYKGLK
ncbi:hypothetical protein [Borrelia sp. RT5S]|uniref:hypothetical protein n=1 Tax=Borrelia sp. RT5S TaxID=2898581 RepID=UPI001E5F9EFB|nr:hypothetical protein [Borrelia sp. RT5S]UGQ16757.1 hypothetical protein LSO06_05400 [Borrelia sp. RT5S]